MVAVDKFISADGHLSEPPDLWTTRMERRFRDRAPRFKPVNGGEIAFVVDGTPVIGAMKEVVEAIFEKQKGALDMSPGGRHEKERPGGLNPHMRLLDQDLDSIAAEVVYPNIGLHLYGPMDAAYQRDAMRAYNEFCAEYCAAEPKRIVGVGMVSISGPIEWAVEDVRRCAKMGLKSVLITAGIMKKSYFDPYYEPLWKVLEDTGMIAALHVGAREDEFPLDRREFGLGDFWIVNQKIVLMAHGLTVFIAAGIPQRHPQLKFVLAEGGIGWIAAVLRLMDHWWEDNRKWIKPHLDEAPSFYFKRQFWATFEDDRAGVLTRGLLGIDRLMWGSDYPHSEGTFPASKARIEKDFADVPAAETRMLVRDNAAKLYGIEV